MFYKKLVINGTEYLIAVNLTGSGAPTESTEADVGMFYMDTDTGDVYKRTLEGWSGTTPTKVSELENDEGYVKNTDYATKTVAGVVKVNNYAKGLAVDENTGELQVYPAEQRDINAKQVFNKPVGVSNFDYAVSKGTHQNMSDDYDVTTFETNNNMSGLQGQLPASYDATKGYIDKKLHNEDYVKSHNDEDVEIETPKNVLIGENLTKTHARSTDMVKKQLVLGEGNQGDNRSNIILAGKKTVVTPQGKETPVDSVLDADADSTNRISPYGNIASYGEQKIAFPLIEEDITLVNGQFNNSADPLVLWLDTNANLVDGVLVPFGERGPNLTGERVRFDIIDIDEYGREHLIHFNGKVAHRTRTPVTDRSGRVFNNLLIVGSLDILAENGNYAYNEEDSEFYQQSGTEKYFNARKNILNGKPVSYIKNFFVFPIEKERSFSINQPISFAKQGMVTLDPRNNNEIVNKGYADRNYVSNSNFNIFADEVNTTKANKTEIPTKLSELENDLSQFDIGSFNITEVAPGLIQMFVSGLGGEMIIGGYKISIQGTTIEIKNLVTPIVDTDAANKGYVDNMIAALRAELLGG